jgi:sec-independent protein translocase protein TatC
MSDDAAEVEESEVAASEMSFGDHLEELRSRLVRSMAAAFIAFFVLFAYGKEVMAIVIAPFQKVANELHISSILNATAPGSSFFATMKVALIAAVIVVAPVWIWQAWSFVSVGLYRNERVWVYRFAPLMILLFVSGVLFGYFLLIPIGLQYLLSFQDPALMQNWIGLGEYLAFFLTLTFVLGLVFQLPIVLALLTRLGILEIETLRTKRRHFILGAFIVSALLTPPDPITQVLMAIPLLFLYELGVFFSWLALGENRPSLDRERWIRRGIIAAVVAVAVALLQGVAREQYRARMLGFDLVNLEEDADEQIPYLSIFRRCAFVDFEPEFALKLEKEKMSDGELEGGAKSREFWVVGGGARALPVELIFRDSRIVVTDAGEGGVARMLIQPSTQSMELALPQSVPGTRLVPNLIEGMRDASDEDYEPVEQLLFGLVGQRPEGLAAGADRERSLEAWEAWARNHPDWHWTRGD